MKDKNIGRYISVLYRHRQMYMNYALKDLNISSSEYIFLTVLYNNHEGISQEELSTMLLIDKGATARAIKSLEEKGMISREKDDRDKRVNRIYTTALGRDCKPCIKTAMLGWTELLTEGMEEEVVDLVFNSLKAMTERLGGINYKELLENRSDANEGDK